MRDRAARGIILVLDENLSGRRIVNGLRDNGLPVRPQTDLMARGITDKEVLAALGPHPEYFLLSKDSDFHRKPAVKETLIQHGIGAFVITAHKNKTAADLVDLNHSCLAPHLTLRQKARPALCCQDTRKRPR